jgi:putative transposase
MDAMKNEHSVIELADALEVSASGHAGHQHKDQRPRRRDDVRLGERLRVIFEENRRTYGSPRLQAALRQQGRRVGKNRISRLQRTLGLRPVQKRRWRPRTTTPDPALPVAENYLAKVPAPDRPNQIWVADITYLPVAEGWLYMAAVMDLFSRKIVGWNLSASLSTALVTGAWTKAWQNRRPPPGLLHHSDRGCQYASAAFRALLENHRAAPSMSRKANCYDNAAMESFWATLKTECAGLGPSTTKTTTRLLIFDFIEAFYNRSRLHSSLHYQSPLHFESLKTRPFPPN